MANISLNTNYPYALASAHTSFQSTTTYGNYVMGESVGRIKTESNPEGYQYQIYFPFDYLDYSTSAGDEFGKYFSSDIPSLIRIGKIKYYYSKSNDDDKSIYDVPIDMIVNKTALNNVASFYNVQNQKYTYNFLASDYNKIFTKYNDNENLFKVIQYLKVANNILIPNANIRATDTSNKFYQLYNDVVGDQLFAENIYRIADNSTDFVVNLNTTHFKTSRLCSYTLDKFTYAIIPMFTANIYNVNFGYEAQYQAAVNINFYLNIRGIRVPMKKVLLSKVCPGSQYYEFTYAFIMPEYILKKYAEYYNSISYIETDYGYNNVLIYNSNISSSISANYKNLSYYKDYSNIAIACNLKAYGYTDIQSYNTIGETQILQV